MNTIKAEQVSVYGKDCIGCKRHESDVMMGVCHEETGKTEFMDIFLSNEQARNLAQDILSRVEENLTIVPPID